MPQSLPLTPYPDLIGIICASGQGRRFGFPKADALLDGRSFLEISQRLLLNAGLGYVFSAVDMGTDTMLDTLRAAVTALRDRNPRGYMIHLVDHPFVEKSTLIALAEAFTAHPDAVYRPSMEGKSGHPIIIPSWVDLFADDGNAGLAGIIRTQVCTVIDVPVQDPGILRNINYPQELLS